MGDIDYDDYRALTLLVAKSFDITDFQKQVVKDGGQVFVGVISPAGTKVLLAFNNPEFDDMIEEKNG